MTVPFGFSVGDLITGIKLIIDAVQSLNETRGARANYKEFLRELVNLTKALECIESSRPDITDPALVTAVNNAIKDCNTCVEDFMQRNNNFSTLETLPTARWSLAGLKTRGRMVQWTLCKTTDVARFRGEVQLHVDSIQMLLATILVKQNSQQSTEHKSLIEGVCNRISEMGIEQQNLKRAFRDQHRAIGNDLRSIDGRQTCLEQISTQGTATNNDSVHLQDQCQQERCRVLSTAIMEVQADVHKAKTQVDALRTLEESMAGGTAQYQRDLFQKLRETATKTDTIIMNQEAMIANQQRMLTDLHDIVTISRMQQDLPPQILLSAPILFLDARGRRAGFYLEFIDSIEAFVAVLKLRFEDIGLRKVERGQFALEDTGRKRNLSLTMPWSRLVRPGQHISMTMIFRLQKPPTADCPGCGRNNDSLLSLHTIDIQCGNIACGMTYRIVAHDEGNDVSGGKDPFLAHSGVKGNSFNDQYEAEDDVKYFTRVQILTHPQNLPKSKRKRLAPSSQPLQMTPEVVDGEAGANAFQKSDSTHRLDELPPMPSEPILGSPLPKTLSRSSRDHVSRSAALFITRACSEYIKRQTQFSTTSTTSPKIC